MTYVCQLDAGQGLYLDNQGAQTIVTLIQSSPGQQQQSTNRYLTGPWTTKPTVVKSAELVIITIFSATKTTQIMVQGQTMTVSDQVLDLHQAESLHLGQMTTFPAQSVTPLEPLPPLKLGEMEMQMQPMTMRMGNMRMGFSEQNQQAPTPVPKQFCSQCGHALAKGDRFCSQCGQRL
ncbi:MAG: zinc ribbon domain-containing protein [Synechococcus sp.]|nr:zinc ribbon domain-containing protein [Synechococcus sp.]